MGFSRGPSIVKDGLVLALDAANQKSYPGSGTTWNDLSGNGNNGTLVNGPTFNSDNLGSIEFDGVDDYAEFPPQPISWNSMYSFGAWVYLEGSGGRQTVFRRTTSSSNRNSLMINPTFVQFTTWNGSTYNSIIADIPNILNKWSFICCTQTNGTNRSLFLNGLPIPFTSGGANLLGLSTSLNFFINTQDTGNGQSRLEGKISYTTLYINKILTPEEILQNYNATKSRYGL